MERNENQEKHRIWRQEHYKQEDINGKLVISLRDISHRMRGLNEGRGSQKRILIVLSEMGVVTQRELTEHLGIQPGSASETIAKLENAGLVVRTTSEADRRTTNISLTEEGQRQAMEAKKQRVQRHQEMFSVLGEEEKEKLLALLERINTDWENRYADCQPQGHHHHCGNRGDFGKHFHENHGMHENHEHHHGCNHDCANCEHPCGRGKNRQVL